MTAPAPDPRRRSCFEKKRYADERQARSVAGKCFDKRGERLRVYGCHECGGLHLTRDLAGHG